MPIYGGCLPLLHTPQAQLAPAAPQATTTPPFLAMTHAQIALRVKHMGLKGVQVWISPCSEGRTTGSSQCIRSSGGAAARVLQSS